MATNLSDGNSINSVACLNWINGNIIYIYASKYQFDTFEIDDDDEDSGARHLSRNVSPVFMPTICCKIAANGMGVRRNVSFISNKIFNFRAFSMFYLHRSPPRLVNIFRWNTIAFRVRDVCRCWAAAERNSTSNGILWWIYAFAIMYPNRTPSVCVEQADREW